MTRDNNRAKTDLTNIPTPYSPGLTQNSAAPRPQALAGLSCVHHPQHLERERIALVFVIDSVRQAITVSCITAACSIDLLTQLPLSPR